MATTKFNACVSNKIGIITCTTSTTSIHFCPKPLANWFTSLCVSKTRCSSACQAGVNFILDSISPWRALKGMEVCVFKFFCFCQLWSQMFCGKDLGYFWCLDGILWQLICFRLKKMKGIKKLFSKKWHFLDAKFKSRLQFLRYFMKNFFTLFLPKKLKVSPIWILTHQSKAQNFYFDHDKKFDSNFWNLFWKTDKVKFHKLKFSVCLHTNSISNLWNWICLFFTKFSKIRLKIFFISK